jgi:hypothetical protein
MALAPHKIAGISGGRDETGVITITQPWWCETLEECFSVGDSTLNINSSTRLPELTRNFGVWDPDSILNGYQIGITYQGPDWSLDLEKVARFGFDSEYSEQPMETHPGINILLSPKYGGRFVDMGGEKKLIFDPVNTGAGEGGGGFSQGQAGNGEVNPNAGYRSYPLYESIWTHTYLVKRLPKDFLDRIGTVVPTPPGRPPTPKGRDWMILVPSLEIFPNESGFRITDFYKLSKPGGWPDVLTTKLWVK